MKSNQKITKYRRYPSLNIGTLLFSIVFIYLVIFVIIYLTQNHVTPYEVVRGSISGNYRFNALSLRTEEMINATQSGNIRYYSREGTKTSAGSAVCAIVNSSQVHQVSYDEFSPSEQELERLLFLVLNRFPYDCFLRMVS